MVPLVDSNTSRDWGARPATLPTINDWREILMHWPYADGLGVPAIMKCRRVAAILWRDEGYPGLVWLIKNCGLLRGFSGKFIPHHRRGQLRDDSVAHRGYRRVPAWGICHSFLKPWRDTDCRIFGAYGRKSRC